jgi:short-subunit dehydrogenase
MTIELNTRYGNRAIIAGASEGIGAAFASFLAARGIDLVLVARKQDALQRFADRLTESYRVRVRCLALDLSDEDAASLLISLTCGLQIDILVYNAALSPVGPFEVISADTLNRAAGVNVITPMNLVHHFGTEMLVRGKGAIILMSSMAGLQGSGFLAAYAATKAFNRVLAESLWYEWKDKGVDIMACCAGATATPGYINSNPAKTSLFAPAVLKPEDVVNECFRKLGRNPSFITGRGNRLASVVMQRLLPRKTAINIMGDYTRKMYGIK